MTAFLLLAAIHFFLDVVRTPSFREASAFTPSAAIQWLARLVMALWALALLASTTT